MTDATPPAVIRSLATAVPPYVLRQAEVAEAARTLFRGRAREELDYLLPVFENAGIETRHSCVPLEWYFEASDWEARNTLYIENAVGLLTRAAKQAIAEGGYRPRDVDTVVTVSTTGVATPSLDAHLVKTLGLRENVERLPIFGLGCAGGVLGLARAAAMAQARPGKCVLFLVAELCALTYRQADQSNANIVATALFGDGAAAAVLACDDKTRGTSGPMVRDWGEHLWPDSLDVMGWRVGGEGLGVIFAQSIPHIVRHQLGTAVDDFLSARGLTQGDLDGLICHPGGAKVVSALEAVFGLPENAMTDARAVLHDYGNMSAVTVFFVLRRFLRRGARGLHLMTSLGPGFTAAFALLDL